MPVLGIGADIQSYINPQRGPDGGELATDVARPTHDDVHAIWINPANSNHVLIGNDGGLAVSYDKARSWTFIPNLPVISQAEIPAEIKLQSIANIGLTNAG